MITTKFIKHTGWSELQMRIPCDKCKLSDRVTGQTNWQGNIDIFLLSGWYIKRSNGDWNYLCPSCNDDASEEQKKEWQEKVDFKKHYNI